jgi:H+/Cl- antiporter ClcA
MTRASSQKRLMTLCVVTILVGIASGFVGTGLAFLLKAVQHIAYGYSPLHLVSPESFLEGVMQASPYRRVLILILCGIVAGVGWWALFRFGKPLVSVPQALNDKKHLPALSTIIHAVLQIVTIGLGSPLGRESAPREMGALFADWLSQRAGLTIRNTQIMVACGAGAGLAAVYNVPLAGALFVIEVLLVSFNWSVVIPALITSTIAVVISWIGLGNESQYHLAQYEVSHSLILWSICSGPFYGALAYVFSRMTTSARKAAPKGIQLLLLCCINFFMIGILAMYFPAILGNGKSPVQLEFSNELSIWLSSALLILRLLITWSSLRAGAQGGLLTPSLANGALLAVMLGGFWNLIWPGTSFNSYSIIGATAFLAAAQKMPITAIVLIFEFTHFQFGFVAPLLCAVAGSLTVFYALETYFHEARKLKNSTFYP